MSKVVFELGRTKKHRFQTQHFPPKSPTAVFCVLAWAWGQKLCFMSQPAHRDYTARHHLGSSQLRVSDAVVLLASKPRGRSPFLRVRAWVGVFWCIFGSTQLSLSAHVESSYDQQPDSVCWVSRPKRDGRTRACARVTVSLPHCLLRMCCLFHLTPPRELQWRIERHVRCPPRPRGDEGDCEGRPWLVRREHVGVYASAVSTSWSWGAKKLKEIPGGRVAP